jgi:hypothetical protein
MVRKLEHKEGIISGVDVRDILKVFPQIEDKFRQRKTYDEYYFDEVDVDVNIKQLTQLSEMFSVNINWESITLS